MKKILFLLVLIYNFAFSSTVSTTYEDFISRKSGLACTSTLKTSTIWSLTSGTSYSYDGGNRLLFSKGVSTRGDSDGNNGHFTIINFTCHTPEPNEPLCVNNVDSNGVLYCKSANDLDPDYNVNPDPLGGGQCRDLFQKDGVAYTCNPNSNEATPIPNSNGTMLDPETGTDKPNCNDGYDSTEVASFPQQGSTAGGYTTWGCAATTPNGGDTGNTSGTGGTSEPTVTTNPDGSKTWNSPDGNTYNLTANGTLTTTYPDGSSSVSQVGSGYQAGSSGTSGGSGSSGGGTGGKSGNTTNEDNTTPTEDTPIDNTPASNSCTDSTLTLQEKMLCELNAGMKKQNSEGNPQNSLNQLLKDLKTSNQTDNTAMNTNLKDIKALNENQLNKQTQANATLEKINDSANATELYTKVMNESMNKIIGDDSTPTPDLTSLKDSSSWINGVFSEYTTFYNNLKDSGNSFTTFANSAKDTINQGFTFNLTSSQMVNCPLHYVIDLSSMGQESININVDFCEQTSKLRPYLYPFILIILFISIIYFTLSFIRGL